MAWLLDTNVLSELRRPRPDPRVVALVSGCPLEELYVSSVVFAEIRFGIALVDDYASKAELTAWLENTTRPMFAGRVLELTENVMLRWRFLVEDGRKVGRTYSQPDLMIAATALEHGMTLATRNVKDFASLGVALFNPWNDLQTTKPLPAPARGSPDRVLTFVLTYVETNNQGATPSHPS